MRLPCKGCNPNSLPKVPVKTHSAAFRPDMTLVTYTWNDAEHAHALLESLREWDVLPKQVIVVDDGSADPFATTWDLLPLRIMRLPENRGRTEAKRAGLSAVTTRFILSLDNDIRLAPDWCATCLPLASKNDVGIVSTPLHHASGGNVDSRYLAHAYSLQLGVSGDVDFIPGGAWLMRRAVWDAVDGFGVYDRPFGQDAHFCTRVAAAGLRLVLTTQSEAREVRAIPRHVIMRRGWRWQGHHIKGALDEGRPLDEACNVLLYTVRERMARSMNADVLFVYLDLLYMLYAMTDLLTHAMHLGREIATQWGPLASARRLLAPYPALRAQLEEDLARLKVVMPESAAGATALFDLAGVLRPSLEPAVCAALEAGVPELRLPVEEAPSGI